MKISEFTLIKNEIDFIVFHILSMIDLVDEFVFYDSSTDGTTEAIEYLSKEHPKGSKIRIFKDKDCKDLKDDYEKIFNELMRECRGEYLAFIHPDMIPDNILKGKEDWDALSYVVKMRSFSHDMVTEIVKGRIDWWKMFNKNTMGLHYHGHYGADNEDIYFKDITGNSYKIYEKPEYYPYEVKDSGLVMNHYCEAKDYTRRLDKMIKCLLNQHKTMDIETAKYYAKSHPRVTLQTGDTPFGIFEFAKTVTRPPVIFFNKEAIKLTKKFKERTKCLN